MSKVFNYLKNHFVSSISIVLMIILSIMSNIFGSKGTYEIFSILYEILLFTLILGFMGEFIFSEIRKFQERKNYPSESVPVEYHSSFKYHPVFIIWAFFFGFCMLYIMIMGYFLDMENISYSDPEYLIPIGLLGISAILIFPVIYYDFKIFKKRKILKLPEITKEIIKKKKELEEKKEKIKLMRVCRKNPYSKPFVYVFYIFLLIIAFISINYTLDPVLFLFIISILFPFISGFFFISLFYPLIAYRFKKFVIFKSKTIRHIIYLSVLGMASVGLWFLTWFLGLINMILGFYLFIFVIVIGNMNDSFNKQEDDNYKYLKFIPDKKWVSLIILFLASMIPTVYFIYKVYAAIPQGVDFTALFNAIFNAVIYYGIVFILGTIAVILTFPISLFLIIISKAETAKKIALFNVFFYYLIMSWTITIIEAFNPAINFAITIPIIAKTLFSINSSQSNTMKEGFDEFMDEFVEYGESIIMYAQNDTPVANFLNKLMDEKALTATFFLFYSSMFFGYLTTQIALQTISEAINEIPFLEIPIPSLDTIIINSLQIIMALGLVVPFLILNAYKLNKKIKEAPEAVEVQVEEEKLEIPLEKRSTFDFEDQEVIELEEEEEEEILFQEELSQISGKKKDKMKEMLKITTDYIHDLSNVVEIANLNDISKNTGFKVKFLRKLVDEMIKNGNINAKLKGTKLEFHEIEVKQEIHMVPEFTEAERKERERTEQKKPQHEEEERKKREALKREREKMKLEKELIKERKEREKKRLTEEKKRAEEERKEKEREKKRLKEERKRNEAERMEKERIEQERKRLEEEKKEQERIQTQKLAEAVQYILKLPQIYEEIEIEKICQKTGLEYTIIENFLEDTILEGALKAKIRGNVLVFIQEEETIKSDQKDVEKESISMETARVPQEPELEIASKSSTFNEIDNDDKEENVQITSKKEIIEQLKGLKLEIDSSTSNTDEIDVIIEQESEEEQIKTEVTENAQEPKLQVETTAPTIEELDIDSIKKSIKKSAETQELPEQVKNCIVCGAKNPANRDNCKICGAELGGEMVERIYCEKCGTLNFSSNMRCEKCGNKL